MSFGTNLQFLRKMNKGMTQENLAERLGVSRQTISKWEMDLCFPEMEKALVLCELFNCSLDELLRNNINTDDEKYTQIKIETLDAFHYFMYTVISENPEDDSMEHVLKWAERNQIMEPKIIGWNFPYLSQEQINVYHMHGYAAACIVPEGFVCDEGKIHLQEKQKYVSMTIVEPFVNPFVLIPNAYKTLARYIEVNKLNYSNTLINDFEYSYEKDGVSYMDIHLAIRD